MEIRQVMEDKKRYLPLLLLADEQEDMIDRYLERGTMYVLDDGGVVGECVVTGEGDGRSSTASAGPTGAASAFCRRAPATAR